MRDRIAEVGCFLGLVTGTLGKIATDVKLMMQTEVEEVYEPFAEGRGSSSTMPQKRNPISSQLHHRLHRDGAPARGGAADAMVEDHERATGPWEIEWIAVPEIFCLAAGALGAGAVPGRGLQVDPEAHARQSRPDARPHRVGGGDDGARPRISAASARTIWSTTSAAR